MHNLAIALKKDGHTISGSDDHIANPSKDRLAAQGLLPESEGWFEDRITNDLDVVILGMHARSDNPELARAQELDIPIYSYPEFLYEVSKNKSRVVVAGSHGKTTVTAMVLHVMNYVEMPINFMVGAQLEGFDCMVELSNPSEFMLMEGDEYLSSPIDRRPKFHLYQPNITVITGIAWDHINVFPTFENYVEQFETYLMTVAPGGALIYNEEDEVLKALVERSPAKIKRFPYRTPDFEESEDGTLISTPEGELPLQIFGAHNVSNVEAARWICLEMGVQEIDFYDAISSFKGAQNRMEEWPTTSSLKVFRDFAHAPSKVKATVKAVAHRFDKVRCVLELHTFSSLNPEFIPQYRGTMDGVAEAWVFYSPKALEQKRMAPLSAAEVAAAFGGGVRVFDSAASLQAALEEPADLDALVLMSSGNFEGLPLKELISRY